jgi:Ca2+-binding RTX toxin-like protein
MGYRATIVRGPGDNKIIGTNNRDVIVAGAGIDMVWGRGGRDVICGGSGSDLLDGGQRIDHIHGGRSRDQCFGQRREHTLNLHHSCEIHSLPLPQPDRPPRVQGQPSPRLVSSTAEAPRTHSFSADIPVCAELIPPYVDYGNLYFTGLYPEGRIAIRILLYDWGPGGWGSPAYSDWDVFSVPADGQVYTVNVGRGSLPNQGFGYVFEVWWGDATTWDANTATYWSPPYYVQRGYGIDLNSQFCA